MQPALNERFRDGQYIQFGYSFLFCCPSTNGVLPPWQAISKSGGRVPLCRMESAPLYTAVRQTCIASLYQLPFIMLLYGCVIN